MVFFHRAMVSNCEYKYGYHTIYTWGQNTENIIWNLKLFDNALGVKESWPYEDLKHFSEKHTSIQKLQIT